METPGLRPRTDARQRQWILRRQLGNESSLRLCSARISPSRYALRRSATHLPSFRPASTWRCGTRACRSRLAYRRSNPSISLKRSSGGDQLQPLTLRSSAASPGDKGRGAGRRGVCEPMCPRAVRAPGGAPALARGPPAGRTLAARRAWRRASGWCRLTRPNSGWPPRRQPHRARCFAACRPRVAPRPSSRASRRAPGVSAGRARGLPSGRTQGSHGSGRRLKAATGRSTWPADYGEALSETSGPSHPPGELSAARPSPRECPTRRLRLERSTGRRVTRERRSWFTGVT